MTRDGLTCRTCGKAFSLPEAVRSRYPGWAPKECLQCRGGGAGASITKERVLPLAEVLERFDGGPQAGVFTDGSCQGNPGPGGWGAVQVRSGSVVAQRYGFDPATTNNRMELTAIIEGLGLVAPVEAVDVYSDSLLVVNTLTKWAAVWEAAGWQRRAGAVKNLDLVQRAYTLVQERPRARIQWIRAHDGSRWNEYADALSTAHLREGL